ncbi:hypothetical protein MPTK1_7g08210 [Marchantia polymorpha subsp. ruderalis]|uniref:Secreted protein n=2 Tax=Marchantia polymorpha TaxID=3197 RepID=A0AAF6BXB8_MARPO|nr:hypothetical protein MARPO_0146s0021 [Marchantia polymorpha]BBN16652.1 hypothetical protein Mp_7g08210 [Marchantia polymorpha subsp. ruderalis]|eukprot:PTQ29199.1 hypothetical protein MARPO_0146s0021 [Marchantia polymorpha]
MHLLLLLLVQQDVARIHPSLGMRMPQFISIGQTIFDLLQLCHRATGFCNFCDCFHTSSIVSYKKQKQWWMFESTPELLNVMTSIHSSILG